MGDDYITHSSFLEVVSVFTIGSNQSFLNFFTAETIKKTVTPPPPPISTPTPRVTQFLEGPTPLWVPTMLPPDTHTCA